jgi:hypothetical protein
LTWWVYYGGAGAGAGARAGGSGSWPGFLNTGPLRIPWNVVPFVPGPFGDPLVVVFTGVDVNYLSLIIIFRCFPQLLGLDSSFAVDGVLIPLRITISSYLVCFPMAFAEPEEREHSLQDIDEFVPDAEGCASPSGWSTVIFEQLLEESLG